jgi:hypothetical protein
MFIIFCCSSRERVKAYHEVRSDAQTMLVNNQVSTVIRAVARDP